MALKRNVKKAALLLGGLLLLPVVYVVVALLFSVIPYNTAFQPERQRPVLIQLHSNGVHTDFLLPVHHALCHWDETFPDLTAESRVVAIGWGDKGFYLNTPTWSDLTFTTAFKAGFGLSTTALHVTSYDHYLRNSDYTVSMNISEAQYLKLCEYIKGSLTLKKGKSQQVTHDPRYYDGHFYDAEGTYSFLTSCNSWVNKGLKNAGISTCLWTPFDWPLLNALRGYGIVPQPI